MKKQILTLLFAMYALAPSFYIVTVLYSTFTNGTDADMMPAIIVGAAVVLLLTYLLVYTFYRHTEQSLLRQYLYHALAGAAGVVFYMVVVNNVISNSAIGRP